MNILKLLFYLFWLIISCSIGLLACLLRPFGVDANVVASRIFSYGILKVYRIHVEVHGAEQLQKFQPCIYVGNHQTGLDVAVYGILFPRNTKIIGKIELVWIPLFGLFLWLAGNILIHRKKSAKARSSIDECTLAIQKEKKSIWIFPEGTRNKGGKHLLPFRKGAFHMAINAQVPIVPIVASDMKGFGILESFQLKSGTVKIKILPPIETKDLTKENVDDLLHRTREVMLKEIHSFTSQEKQK